MVTIQHFPTDELTYPEMIRLLRDHLENPTGLEGYTLDQVDTLAAKRIQNFTCRNCGNQKEYDREWVPLCEMCAENLREKAESYGGESWEIGQRLKSYTNEVNKRWEQGLTTNGRWLNTWQ